MKITTCLNCGSVYRDLNPSNESVDYPDTLDISDLPTIKHNDGYIGYGCKECKTDGHLADNLHNAGGKSSDLFATFEGINKAGYSIDEFQF